MGSVLGPLLFLIYINDLPDRITYICKIFADDTSFFSKVIYTRNSQNDLNYELQSISNWTYQWKLQFNPDPKKQANEIIFSRKSNTYMYPPVTFNNNTITKWVVLDSKVEFNIHIAQKIKNCNKIIGFIRRLSISLPIKSLITVYKSFVRPHLNYRDILYDKSGNQNFENRLEQVQSKAYLTITRAIQGTFRHRLYDELGSMSLSKSWYNILI